MNTATLPADVLALIAPAAEAVRAEARENVIKAEHARMIKHQEVVERAGYDDSGYRAGMENIIDTVFPGAERPDVRGWCQCPTCGDPECQGDCEPCGNAECEQCRCDSGYSCCGWCTGCVEHHGDPTDGDEIIRVDHGRNRITVCKDCQHVCED